MNSSDSKHSKLTVELLREMELFIAKEELCQHSDKIIVAVSGGVDSMILAFLFQQLGYQILIAHVNFQLRGEASNQDEALVKNWTTQQNIPFFCSRVDTKAYAVQHGISTQIAARELRYQWFEALRGKQNAKYIATAHHINDALETSIFHLAKGGGIAGIAGIPTKAGHIIRPLLFASREQLVACASSEGVIWREDASNESDDYQRNFIRHHIVPLLKEINPSLERTSTHTLDRLRQTKALTTAYLAQLSSQVLEFEKDSLLCFNIKALRQSPAPTLLLHEHLQGYGFNYVQAQLISTATEQPTGQTFTSSTHIVAVNQGHARLFIKNEKQSHRLYSLQTSPLSLTTGTLTWVQGLWKQQAFPNSPLEAWFDSKVLASSLTVRPWQLGDRIKPFGMKGSKLVSDILSEQQVPLHLRANILVLCAGTEVLWVIGYRTGRLFKINQKTTSFTAFRWESLS